MGATELSVCVAADNAAGLAVAKKLGAEKGKTLVTERGKIIKYILKFQKEIKMKVSEIKYERYTIEEAQAEFAAFRAELAEAKSADEVIAARERLMNGAWTEYSTSASLANCRFTLDTRDEFYAGEVAYYDEVGPLFMQLFNEFSELMLASPFRAELEKLIGSRRFLQYEISKKSFSEAIVEDMQKENALTTEYSKFMSELPFTYEGETMPLSVLRGKLEDTDREVRRKAAIAIGEGLSKEAATLDRIYDELVHLRDGMAKKLGYKNFVELGYYRMGRLDYNAEMVAKFRENVRECIVPAVCALKSGVADRLSIDGIKFYDEAIYSAGETPKPMGTTAEIFENAQAMYDEMNPEIGAFMREMREAEAFDVESRDGKWGGGYCTAFEKYKQPFILANFNGTSGDIDVITHEFGHAFAAKNAFVYGDSELGVGGMETAECHSMSMEFLSWPAMHRFFADPDKYKYSHFCGALSFIPYGVIVDEFQHIVYENPDMTPEERKAAYRSLEAKYRPYLDYSEIPYICEGTRWQYQMHIYESPFYYIDYCLAQTVALWFLKLSRDDYAHALEKYIEFSRAGGTKSFGELTDAAGIPSPFADGSLAGLADECVKIAKELQK